MVYLVLNLDNSIHTIAEKDNDVLYEGQQRFELDMDMKDLAPDFDNEFYIFDGNNLVRKDETIINNIKSKRFSVIRKQKKIDAQQNLSQIEKLELIDLNEDYTEEKIKYEKIIQDNLG